MTLHYASAFVFQTVKLWDTGSPVHKIKYSFSYMAFVDS